MGDNITTIIPGNPFTFNTPVHFRDQSFITPENREAIEECIHAFCNINVRNAYAKLRILTFWSQDDFPKKLWKKIRLTPGLIPDEDWSSFIEELRYQYKITHPDFMTDFSVPASCSDSYSRLVEETSEFAAHFFCKRIYNFLKDHSHNDIGLNHINFISNRLNWHSVYDTENKKKHLQALTHIYLTSLEANYFASNIDAVRALFENMREYILHLTFQENSQRI